MYFPAVNSPALLHLLAAIRPSFPGTGTTTAAHHLPETEDIEVALLLLLPTVDATARQHRPAAGLHHDDMILHPGDTIPHPDATILLQDEDMVVELIPEIGIEIGILTVHAHILDLGVPHTRPGRGVGRHLDGVVGEEGRRHRREGEGGDGVRVIVAIRAIVIGVGVGAGVGRGMGGGESIQLLCRMLQKFTLKRFLYDMGRVQVSWVVIQLIQRRGGFPSVG